MSVRIILIEAFYSIYVLLQILVYPLLVIFALFEVLKRWLRKLGCSRMPSLCGEVALITGSGRGLGRETAIALAKLGCHLAIVDIQEHLANDTAQFIAENYEVNTKAYKVDVRDYQQLLDLRKRVSNDLGDVTILVNNAAIITMSSIDDPPVHEIQRMININFTAPVLTTKVFLPKMRELNRGYVVNISSLAGMYPHHTFNVYGASKAAVRHPSERIEVD